LKLDAARCGGEGVWAARALTRKACMNYGKSCALLRT